MGARSPARKAIDAPLANPTTVAASTAKSKKNLYAKPDVGKCYRCGEPEHRSNECSKKKQVNIAAYEGEDKVEIETELEDFDFAEEYGESATCMV